MTSRGRKTRHTTAASSCYATRVVGVVALALVAMAHVGSPNVFFDGPAGPYAVGVIVRPPQVVPGLAQVIVRATGADIARVIVRPVYWRTGAAGAPPGDVAKPVPGEPGSYSGNLWLMSRGAYSVYVTVEGAQGSGTAIVPVMSVATGRLGFSVPLAVVLTLLGAFLLGGLITIVYAASGEALASPGTGIAPKARGRARLIATVSAPVIALLVFGGAKWWQAVDLDYQRTMYRPLAGDATLTLDGGRTVLTLRVRDTSSGAAVVPRDPIMPDHGKLMHLFLVRDSSLADFAHLHPVQTEPMSFTTRLPPLPSGRYRVFADLVFETGAEQTVATAVDLVTPPSAGVLSDPDDAWVVGARAAPLGTGALDTLSDGSTMAWSGSAAPIVSGRPIDLQFTVRGRGGALAPIEPYMGMAAHAVVVRDDGSVFVHLHPMGTSSAAAQQVFVLRDRGDTTAQGRLLVNDTSMASAAMPMFAPGTLTLPYAFPKPGHYRIWVQIKRGGAVLTAPFDTIVQ